MKSYEVYKNIRKGALIAGLPLSMFGVVMAFIILSLMMLIFGFSLIILLALIIANGVVYVICIQLVNNPNITNFQKIFPRLISNKKTNDLDYGKEDKFE